MPHSSRLTRARHRAIMCNGTRTYSVRTGRGRRTGSSRSFSVLPFDHFSLPPCTRGRHPTAPFSRLSWGHRQMKKGGGSCHRPSEKDEGDFRPRRHTGRSPKEGDHSPTVAETDRTGCGSSRGNAILKRTAVGDRQRRCLASLDGGVRWLVLGQQRPTRGVRHQGRTRPI